MIKNVLSYIVLICLFLFLQLGAAYFLKIGTIVPNFLIIAIILINIFYAQYYKINTLIVLLLGFIFDMFSILPFGFWMINFFLFFLLSYVFINYLINKKNILNIGLIIMFLLLSFEFEEFILLKIFYEANFINAFSFKIFAGAKEAIYNFLIFLFFYFFINKFRLIKNQNSI